jgi:hypothetical protein
LKMKGRGVGTYWASRCYQYRYPADKRLGTDGKRGDRKLIWVGLEDYRDGTSTRAVAIRASSGTFINVYAHETGNHKSVIWK